MKIISPLFLFVILFTLHMPKVDALTTNSCRTSLAGEPVINMHTDTTDGYSFTPLETTEPLSKISFSFKAGCGWRTAKISSSLSGAEKELVKGVKSGTAWEASLDYYITNDWGFGLYYSGFGASKSINGHIEFNDGRPPKNGTLKMADMISFVGPSVSGRSAISDKWILSGSISLGYLHYLSKLSVSDYEAKITGSTGGYAAMMDIEYLLNKTWGLTFGFSSLSGVLLKMKVDDGTRQETIKLDEHNKESLAQTRLSLGLRFHF